MSRKGFCCKAVAVLAAFNAVVFAGPDEAAIKEKLNKFQESLRSVPRQEMAAKQQEVATELLSGEDFGEYSAEQISMIMPLIQAAPGFKDKALARLETLAQAKSPEALEARMIAATLKKPSPWASPSQEDLDAIITSEYLPKLIASGRGFELFGLLESADAPQYAKHTDTLLKIVSVLPEKIDTDQVDAVAGFYRAMAYAVPNPSKQLESLRSRIIGYVDPVIAELKKSEDPTQARRAASLERTRAQLALINEPAPEMSFLWSSGDEKIASLDDLKGKVVLIDFWATWCGPCIAAFPKVRDLANHYEGYPVQILGVTSIQGSHYKVDPTTNKREKIDTRDDPEKEFGLMPEFMKTMDMNWKVAFSNENVFDPRFGVYGIPHIAIIDPAGKVRINGLNPHGLSEEQEHALIDSILREFNLPTPEASPEG